MNHMESPGNTPCYSRLTHENPESHPYLLLSFLSEKEILPWQWDCIFQASQHRRYATVTVQPFNPATQYCLLFRLKAFTCGFWMPSPNILQARSRTQKQAIQHSTSTTLKCTLMPKNQHGTNCQIIISSSPFPLFPKTWLFLSKVKDTTFVFLPPGA